MLHSFRSRTFAALAFTALFGAGEQVPVTPEIPSSGGGLYQAHVTQKKPAKHVQLHINTWQEQETYGYIGIKYELAAQHKVALFGKSWQEQGITGSIVAHKAIFVAENATQVTQKANILVSAYSLPAITTSQVQVSRGTISTRKSDISDVKDYLTTAAISNVITSQSQHIVGKIELSELVSVSTHSLANVSTAQVHEISGKISTHRFVDVNNTLSVKAATYQQQAISGRITTNDDEMLMVLMALLALDDEIA